MRDPRFLPWFPAAAGGRGAMTARVTVPGVTGSTHSGDIRRRHRRIL